MKLQPVVINRDEVATYFAHKDLSTDPLFDLFVDGDQLGGMLVFKELGLENQIYFMLLPEHKNEYNMIRCVNATDRDRVVHDQWLSRELIELLTQNIVMDEPKEIKVQYMELINFAIGHELNQLYDSFTKGVNDNFPNADESMKEEIKIEAAKRILDWSNRSVKFREWIAPAYDIDIEEAGNFVDQMEAEEEKPETPAFSSEQRARKPPDAFSPGKEDEREKELKAAATKSKLPVPVAPTRKQESNPSSSKSGDGIAKVKVIVIAPDAEDRFKRLHVILGSREAGNNANTLDEYTSILDSLLKDGKIDKKGYKKFLKIFNKK